MLIRHRARLSAQAPVQAAQTSQNATKEPSEWLAISVPQPTAQPVVVMDLNGRGERIRTSDPLVPNQFQLVIEIC
jgi:hypothetical protein